MLFPEEHAAFLKAWIVKRLENTSDADADVLADYVLALLRHDGTAEEVKALCEEEIPDFLKEDTAVFVNDVFDAIQYKSYLPGAPPAPRRKPGQPSALGLPTAATWTSATPAGGASEPAVPTGPGFAPLGNGFVPTGPAHEQGFDQGAQQGRGKKRSYNDREDGGGAYTYGQFPGARPQKQPRRFQNGGRDGAGAGPGRGGFQNNQGNFMMPPMPPPPPLPTGPGMPPLDPKAAMDAMLRLQSMGFPMPPQLPGGPPMGNGAQPAQARQRPRKRCRDYDEKGFCARGAKCRFQHGPDAPEPVQALPIPPVPNGGDQIMTEEYDPNNATLPLGPLPTPGLGQFPLPYLPLTPEHERNGSDMQSRGRGRGRGGMRGRGGARASFSADGPMRDKTKSTVVVENIPEENFIEEQVREFFAQYGNILEVSMQPYKRLAIVKYDNWAAANAAWKSPKVIFDNRFVKVYWYKQDGSNLPTSTPLIGSNGRKTGTPNGTNGSPAAEGLDADEAMDWDPEEFARKQEEAQKAHDEKAAKKAEVEKQKAELEKRQKELLAKQQEEKQRLLAKLSAATAASSGGDTSTEATNGTPKPTNQSDALRAQLALLEEEAKQLGLDPEAAEQEQPYWASRGGRGRGRGSFSGYAPRGYRGSTYRGRGGAPTPAPHAAYAQFSLDNRPRKVAISGVDFTASEKDEALRQHLFVSP
jgi:RNA-binding protein 26